MLKNAAPTNEIEICFRELKTMRRLFAIRNAAMQHTLL